MYGFTFGTMIYDVDGSNYVSAQTMNTSSFTLRGVYNDTNHTFYNSATGHHINDLDEHLVAVLSGCAHALEAYQTITWQWHLAFLCILLLSIVLAFLLWQLTATVWSVAQLEANQATQASMHAHVKDAAMQTGASVVRSSKRAAKIRRRHPNTPVSLDRFRLELAQSLYNDTWEEWSDALRFKRWFSVGMHKHTQSAPKVTKVGDCKRACKTELRNHIYPQSTHAPKRSYVPVREKPPQKLRRISKNEWFQCACEYGCPVWIYRQAHEVNAMCSRCYIRSKGNTATCPGKVRATPPNTPAAPDAPARVYRGHRGAGHAAARVAHSLTFLLHSLMFCTLITPVSASAFRLVPVEYILSFSGLFAADAPRCTEGRRRITPNSNREQQDDDKTLQHAQLIAAGVRISVFRRQHR